MKVLYNTTKTKGVRIVRQSDDCFITMYFQIYSEYEQVLETKLYKKGINAQKWADKLLK